jgi:hypothetical protein
MTDDRDPAAPAVSGEPIERRFPVRLWTLTNEEHTCRAELVDQGEAGFELQLFIDGERSREHRHSSRGPTLGQAEMWRGMLEGKGWKDAAPPEQS